MQSDRKAAIAVLMPVSIRLDDFLGRYEYIDVRDPASSKALLTLMNSVQMYVNGVYAEMRVTKQEWEEISKDLRIIDEKPTTNNDEGAPGIREDDGGPEDGGGEPGPVQAHQ